MDIQYRLISVDHLALEKFTKSDVLFGKLIQCVVNFLGSGADS